MTKSSSSIKGLISLFECSSSSFSSSMKASRGVSSFSGGVGNNLKFSSRLLNHENKLPILFCRSFRVVCQLKFSSLPIDFWIVFVQPRKTEDNPLFP